MRPQLALPFEGGNAKVGAAAESPISADSEDAACSGYNMVLLRGKIPGRLRGIIAPAKSAESPAKRAAGLPEPVLPRVHFKITKPRIMR